jgi:hypothetical protein
VHADYEDYAQVLEEALSLLLPLQEDVKAARSNMLRALYHVELDPLTTATMNMVAVRSRAGHIISLLGDLEDMVASEENVR